MDPFTGGALIGIGGSIAGNIIGNQASARQAGIATRANFQAQHNQQAFQQRMMDERHQRTTADLKKAGLNPLLAVGNPGGGQSGASAQGVAAEQKNPLEGAVSSALQAKQLGLATKKAEAEVSNMKANTNKQNYEAEYAKKEALKADYLIRAMKMGESLVTGAKNVPKTIQETTEKYRKKYPIIRGLR